MLIRFNVDQILVDIKIIQCHDTQTRLSRMYVLRAVCRNCTKGGQTGIFKKWGGGGAQLLAASRGALKDNA